MQVRKSLQMKLQSCGDLANVWRATLLLTNSCMAGLLLNECIYEENRTTGSPLMHYKVYLMWA